VRSRPERREHAVAFVGLARFTAIAASTPGRGLAALEHLETGTLVLGRLEGSASLIEGAPAAGTERLASGEFYRTRCSQVVAGSGLQ
jgi:hypothetical protein